MYTYIPSSEGVIIIIERHRALLLVVVLLVVGGVERGVRLFLRIYSHKGPKSDFLCLVWVEASSKKSTRYKIYCAI